MSQVHQLIDLLNPDLRACEVLNDKLRKREFFAMTPESAYKIFNLMAILHNRTEALQEYDPTAAEKQDEEDAEEIDTIQTERSANFSFSKCGIQPNEHVRFEWIHFEPVVATVVNLRNNDITIYQTEDGVTKIEVNFHGRYRLVDSGAD